METSMFLFFHSPHHCLKHNNFWTFPIFLPYIFLQKSKYLSIIFYLYNLSELQSYINQFSFNYLEENEVSSSLYMFEFTPKFQIQFIFFLFFLFFSFSDVKSIQPFLLNCLQTGGSCSLCISEFD